MEREYEKLKFILNKKPHKRGITNYNKYWDSLRKESEEEYFRQQYELVEDELHVWFSRKTVTSFMYKLFIGLSIVFIFLNVILALIFLVLSFISQLYMKHSDQKIISTQFFYRLLEIDEKTEPFSEIDKN